MHPQQGRRSDIKGGSSDGAVFHQGNRRAREGHADAIARNFNCGDLAIFLINFHQYPLGL